MKHEERPATHNKRAQTYMLSLAVFIVIVFAVSAYTRMQGGQPSLFSERETAQPRILRQPPKTTLEGFEDQVAAAKKKLERLAQPEAELEPVRIEAEEEWGVETPAIDWPDELPSVKREGSSLAEKEQKMVEKSRTTPLKVSLGFAKAPSPARAIRAQAASSPGPITGARSLDQEIQRVRTLRANLRTNPGAVAGPADGLAALSALSPGGAVSGESLSAPVPPAPSNVVGQAKSSPTKRLPGQKLLPLTTVISAVLDQKAISDYEGPLRLLVTQDVYDIDKAHVLIPKGSKVLAQSLLVSNVNALIQSRMGIAVQSMVLPDGKSIDFSRQAALDREGVAAVEGDADYHLIEQFLGVAAFALLTTGTSRAGSGANSDTTFEGEFGQATRRQFSPLLQRYLQLVPTITLEAGTPMRIFLQEELYIFPWSTVGERYVSTH